MSAPEIGNTDTERLNWLEGKGFATRVPDGPYRSAGVHNWASDRWTAHWVSSEFTSARAAIDAAMAMDPDRVKPDVVGQ